MSIWGPIIGAAASLGGGLLGAKSAGDSTAAQLAMNREGIAATKQNASDNLIPSLFALLGGSEGERMARLKYGGAQWDELFGVAPTAGQTLTTDEQRELEGLTSQRDQALRGAITRRNPRGNPNSEEVLRLNAQIDALTKKAGGDPGKSGRFDLEKLKASAGPGVIGDMDKLTSEFGKRGKEQVGRFDADSRKLLLKSGLIEKMAQDYGKGQSEAIDRDTNEGIDRANRAGLSRLAGSGLGNSTLAPALMNANAAEYSRIGGDQKRALADEQIRMRTGLAGNTLGLDASRSGARTALQQGVNDQDLTLQQQPLNTRLSLYTGPLFNANQNASPQFYQGGSPSASSNAALAASLSAAGGQFLGGGFNNLFGTQSRGGGTAATPNTNANRQMGAAGTSNYNQLWAA